MMRTFELLYVRETNKWSIIAKDPGDKSWFLFVSGIDDEETTREIVDALMAKQYQQAH